MKNLWILIGLSLWLAGCGPEDKKKEINSETEVSVTPEKNTLNTHFQLEDFSKEFRGNLDGEIPVVLKMQNAGGALSGEILYVKTKKTSPFNGSLSNLGTFQMQIESESGGGILSGAFVGAEQMFGHLAQASGGDPMEFIGFSSETDREKAPGPWHGILCPAVGCTLRIEVPGNAAHAPKTDMFLRQILTALLPPDPCPQDSGSCKDKVWFSQLTAQSPRFYSGFTGKKSGEKIAREIFWTLDLDERQAIFLSDFITQPLEFLSRIDKLIPSAEIVLLNEYEFFIENQTLFVKAISTTMESFNTGIGFDKIQDLINTDHFIGQYISQSI